MHLAVAAGLGIGLLSWVTPAALSQQASTSIEESSVSIKAAPSPAPALQITGSLDFTRSVQQQRAIRDLVDTMNVRDESKRALELQTLHEAPLTTFLNLSRFLTHKPYKRKDGSPLFDLTF
ncbi:MAG: hypothetical protein QOI07_41 [Verrucomicrobiota bacterium]|jgi:hypothetical protein